MSEPNRPEWEMTTDDYFRRMGLDPKSFEDALHLPRVESVMRVLPLRDLKQVDCLVPMHFDMLCYIVRRTRTLGGDLFAPDANLHLSRMDSRQLKIGQKFVYRENYQGLIEEVPDIFSHFCVCSGLGDVGPHFAFGHDTNNCRAMACYLPPIIERLGPDYVIMDGIHRNYIAKQTGKPTNVIIVENVALPFPCSARDWIEIRVISLAEKPKDPNERYFDHKRELFRDLKYLGIDG